MIYALFPMIAAMCYGLAFAMTEKALKITNVVTYMAVNSASSFLIVAYLLWIKGESLKFDFIHDQKDLVLIIIAATIPTLGWTFTLFAVKNTSALYASFAEISYPLFTVIFLFIFFGLRSIDWTILLGGALIMIGSFIMVYGQSKR